MLVEQRLHAIVHEGSVQRERAGIPHHALVVGCHLLAVGHQELAALLVLVGSAEGTLLLPRHNAFLLPGHDQRLSCLRSQSA